MIQVYRLRPTDEESFTYVTSDRDRMQDKLEEELALFFDDEGESYTALQVERESVEMLDWVDERVGEEPIDQDGTYLDAVWI